MNKTNLNNIQNIESITRKLQTEGVWGLVHDTILLRWFRNLSPDPYDLFHKLQNYAFDIIEKTHFISTKEIANDALCRVAEHKAPGGKKSKSESKDCAVWLTMFALCRRLNVYHYAKQTPIIQRNFITVNTSDFADKSGVNIVYQQILVTEATQERFSCSFTYVDAASKLGL